MKLTLFFAIVLFASVALAKDLHHAKRGHARSAHVKHSRGLAGKSANQNRLQNRTPDIWDNVSIECVLTALDPYTSSEEPTQEDVDNTLSDTAASTPGDPDIPPPPTVEDVGVPDSSKRRLSRHLNRDITIETLFNIMGECYLISDDGNDGNDGNDGDDGDDNDEVTDISTNDSTTDTEDDGDDKKKRHLSRHQKHHKARSHHATRKQQKQ